MHLDRYTFNTYILYMEFSSLNLAKHDIQFLIGDYLGSDHLTIEIAIDTPPHRNIHINPVRYKFNQTDREVFKSTLEAALSSGDVPELKSTQDIDKYADFITTAISTAVDKGIPQSKSGRPESQPILDETLVLIKEKRKLRRQYSQAHDPLVKTGINQLHKEIKDNLGEKPPPRHKPPDENPLEKNPPCQKPPRQSIHFRNFITFVFRTSYGKEISVWFLAVKHIRHGFIK